MSLTQALQTLTAHPDVHRAHKLLYWVYKGQWPETMACLYQHPLDDLLKKLVRRTPSLAVLERRLYKAAAALTKPEEYQQIAALILDAAALLYPEARVGIAPVAEPTRLAAMAWDEEAASPITALALEEAAPEWADLPQEELAPTFVLMPDLMPEEDAAPALVILPEPEVSGSIPTAPRPEDVANPPTRPSDRFALRQFLMQQAPPLKIKILLFCALRHSFTFMPEDWKALKAQTLDAWLTELLETFPTLERLEQQLFTQAASLKTLDQGMQIAETIVQAVRLQAR